MVLGASGWQTFWHVTLPNIKWGLIYGVILVQRPRHGRVRRGVGGVRPHPRPDQHHAAARRILYNEYQSVPPPCRGLAAGPAGAGHPWSSSPSSVAVPAPEGPLPTCPRNEPAGVPHHEHRIRNVSKAFGTSRALGREPGHRVRRTGRLLGPSAAARPRCCASSPGWKRPTRATSCSAAKTPPTCTCASATVGFVFQHYALFRHMTVFDNVAFGLRMRPRPRPLGSADPRRCMDLLKLVQLDWLADRFPPSSQAASASASPWRAPGRRAQGAAAGRTLRRARMPRCARNCAAGCAACTTNCTSPASSSPTTRRGHGSLRTAW